MTGDYCDILKIKEVCKMAKLSKKDQDRILADIQAQLPSPYQDTDKRRDVVISKKEYTRLVDMVESAYLKKACGQVVEETETLEHYDEEGALVKNKFGYYKTVKITNRYIPGDRVALETLLAKLKPDIWGDAMSSERIIIIDDVGRGGSDES